MCLRAPHFTDGCAWRYGLSRGPVYRPPHNRRSTLSAARTPGSSTHLFSDLSRALRAGQPISGMSVPRRGPFGSCVSGLCRPVRASLTIRRATSVSHEPKAHTWILGRGCPCPAEPTHAKSNRALIRRWSRSLAPLGTPARRQRLDHGRGPATGGCAGPRGTREVARHRPRRRGGQRSVAGQLLAEVLSYGAAAVRPRW